MCPGCVEAERVRANLLPHTPENCGISDCLLWQDHVHDRDLHWKGPYR